MAKKTTVKDNITRSCIRTLVDTRFGVSKMDCRVATVWVSEEIYKEYVRRPSGRIRNELALGASPSFGNEAIADPRLRLDVLAAGFVFELLAQLPNKNPQVFGLVCGLGSPHGCEQSAMGHDFACMTSEMQEEFEFLGS